MPNTDPIRDLRQADERILRLASIIGTIAFFVAALGSAVLAAANA